MSKDIVLEKYLTNDYFNHNETWGLQDSPWKAKHVAKMIKKNNISHSTICDVGCGAGGVLASLREYFPTSELVGFDIAPAAEKFWESHKSKEIRFQRGDFIKDSQEKFDSILLLDVLEHISDPHTFLTQLIPKTSYLIVHFPLDLSAQSVLREKPLLNVREKVGHIHYFTKNLALRLLNECGYEVLDWSYSGAVFTAPNKTWKTHLSSLPRSLIYAIHKDIGVRMLGGETLFVVART